MNAAPLQPPASDDPARTAERLGPRLYALRRQEEEDRIAEFCQYVSPKFTYVKIHFIRPVEIAILKLFGLYARGRREFHKMEVVESDIAVPGLPPALEGYTILQMSDLHIDIDPALVETIGATIARLRYDACVLTGDYKNLTVGDSAEAVALLKRLRPSIRTPAYAVLGNHDTLDMVAPLERAGYRFLLNESVLIRRGDGKVLLAGVDDPYIYKTHSIENALAGAPAADVRILLAHSPTIYAEAEAAGFDAMLCGHTHGGQVCLPNGYPILSHDRCPRRFISGRWTHGRLQGHTSRGTGGCGLPIRLFCKPEITLHHLRRPSQEPELETPTTRHSSLVTRHSSLLTRHYRGRLAPSPTGALHLGNARTFMIAWLRARSQGGEVVLRMEDLDHPKNKPGAAAAAIEDLRWLGFDWDEGPDVGGPCGPYVQTARRALYADALGKLVRDGRAYPCICARKDLEAAQSAPHVGETLYYPGTCRGLYPSYQAAREAAGGRLPAWRFRVADGENADFNDVFCGSVAQDVSSFCGDFLLARDEEGAGYMLAVVVDDAAMGITEVVRGDDLLETTPRQLLVYKALGLEPPRFLHVPLVLGSDGFRLAKRHGDTRVAAFREAGVPPERLIGMLAHWCGWAEEGESIALHDLIGRFDLSRLPRQPVVWQGETAATSLASPPTP